MRKTFLLATIAFTAATALACEDDLTGVSGEVVGTYQLESVNGSLPYVATTPAPPTTYIGGELDLTSDGNFDRTYNVATTGGVSELHVTGTWERIGSAIRLESSDGVVWAEFREDDRAIIVHDKNEADWRYER